MACMLYTHLKCVWKQQLVSQYHLKISSKSKRKITSICFCQMLTLKNGIEMFLVETLSCYNSQKYYIFLLALENSYRVNVRIY